MPIETVRSMVRGMFVPPSEAISSAVQRQCRDNRQDRCGATPGGRSQKDHQQGDAGPDRERKPRQHRGRPRSGRAVAEHDAVLGLGVRRQRVARAQLGGDGAGELRGESPGLVELGQLGLFLGRGEHDPTTLGLQDRVLGVAFIGGLGVTHAGQGEPAADHRGQRGDEQDRAARPRAEQALDDPCRGDDPVVGIDDVFADSAWSIRANTAVTSPPGAPGSSPAARASTSWRWSRSV